jgi:hypothetical protein
MKQFSEMFHIPQKTVVKQTKKTKMQRKQVEGTKTAELPLNMSIKNFLKWVELCYLNSRITSDRRAEEDFVSRLPQTAKTFNQKCLITAKETSLEVRRD